MGQRAEDLLARVEDRVVHDILVDLTERVVGLEATMKVIVECALAGRKEGA